MCQVLRSGVKNDEIWATDNTGLKSQYQGLYIGNKPRCRVGRSGEGFQRLAVRGLCPK